MGNRPEAFPVEKRFPFIQGSQDDPVALRQRTISADGPVRHHLRRRFPYWKRFLSLLQILVSASALHFCRDFQTPSRFLQLE